LYRSRAAKTGCRRETRANRNQEVATKAPPEVTRANIPANPYRNSSRYTKPLSRGAALLRPRLGNTQNKSTKLVAVASKIECTQSPTRCAKPQMPIAES